MGTSEKKLKAISHQVHLSQQGGPKVTFFEWERGYFVKRPKISY